MPETLVTIRGDYITLSALLKFSGAVVTGGQAKESVLAGAVLVNGEVCKERGKKIRPGDEVAFAGRRYRVQSQQGEASGKT